jgi:hypothetical protein
MRADMYNAAGVQLMTVVSNGLMRRRATGAVPA